MEDQVLIVNLLSKSLLLDLSRAERIQLEEWLEKGNNRLLYEHLREKAALRHDIDLIDLIESRKAAVYNRLFNGAEEPVSETDKPKTPGLGFRIPFIGHVHISDIVKFAAAAAIILILSLVVSHYFLKFTGPEDNGSEARATKSLSNDIPPGTNKATLTVSNGDKIMLDSTAKINYRAVDGIYVNSDGALLTYSSVMAEEKDKVLFHELSTPRAGQYKLVLPDKSIVFLNAASTIRYPVAFTGKKRVVELMAGEAFFEVAKNAEKPFVVKLNRPAGDPYEVRVTGTHFRISAYPGEMIRTSLIEGALQVHTANEHKILKPGQAVILSAHNELLMTDTTLDQPSAFVDGSFVFNDESVVSVMKKVERWYDVEVIFKGEPASRCDGTIPRNSSLQFVLRSLENASNHQAYFKLEGRTVTVYAGPRKQ